jgi:hypothetical protein
MTDTASRPGTGTTVTWLHMTWIGCGLAIVGLLAMGLTMLIAPATFDGPYEHVADYVLTAAALPHGLGLLLVTVGFHRLQGGRDGRLGTVGVWIYAVCMTELVVQCMASVVAGTELIWGPLYPLCAFGLMLGLALLAAGSWRVGLLPRWMLGVWPPLGVVGSFLGVGPIPLFFVAFLVLLPLELRRRVGVVSPALPI